MQFGEATLTASFSALIDMPSFPFFEKDEIVRRFKVQQLTPRDIALLEQHTRIADDSLMLENVFKRCPDFQSGNQGLCSTELNNAPSMQPPNNPQSEFETLKWDGQVVPVNSTMRSSESHLNKFVTPLAKLVFSEKPRFNPAEEVDRCFEKPVVVKPSKSPSRGSRAMFNGVEQHSNSPPSPEPPDHKQFVPITIPVVSPITSSTAKAEIARKVAGLYELVSTELKDGLRFRLHSDATNQDHILDLGSSELPAPSQQFNLNTALGQQHELHYIFETSYIIINLQVPEMSLFFEKPKPFTLHGKLHWRERTIYEPVWINPSTTLTNFTDAVLSDAQDLHGRYYLRNRPEIKLILTTELVQRDSIDIAIIILPISGGDLTVKLRMSPAPAPDDKDILYQNIHGSLLIKKGAKLNLAILLYHQEQRYVLISTIVPM
jgi:hypothetical protein